MRHALIALWLATLLCAGCTPSGDTPDAGISTQAITTPAEQYATLQAKAKGLRFGPEQSDYTVFVVFDPQCLHCARLWEESRELTRTVQFVWVPVSFFDGSSKPISAALLAAADPAEEMNRVMASVVSRSPSVADQYPAPYLEASIASNTALVNRFGILSIPYVVARDQTTSHYIARAGGMSRETLKRFLGIASR